jgi:DNA-binding response OmpR family regulator
VAGSEFGRVLIVTGAPESRAAVMMRNANFDVLIEPGDRTGTELFARFEALRPDLLLLELDIVRRAVIDLCMRVRAVSGIPIVVVCEASDDKDAISMFRAGADAFISHPVGAHELVARVRALFRRTPPVRAWANADELTVGSVRLDRSRRVLMVGGSGVAVPRREFDIAEMLMRRAPRVVTRDELIRTLWGTSRDTKSLDVQVGRLRARLLAADGRSRIVTVRGVGFRFLDDDEINLTGARAVGVADELVIDLEVESLTNGNTVDVTAVDAESAWSA